MPKLDIRIERRSLYQVNVDIPDTHLLPLALPGNGWDFATNICTHTLTFPPPLQDTASQSSLLLLIHGTVEFEQAHCLCTCTYVHILLMNKNKV